jgi:hypothetical protein
MITAGFGTRGITGTAEQLKFVSDVLERPVDSLDDLSKTDAETVIHFMKTGAMPVPPATEPEAPDAFTVIDGQIRHTATDEDARAVVKEIGEQLAAGRITKSDAQLLRERLQARGRKAGAP